MIEVKIPSDIHAYKSKLIMGLSTRQLISVGATIMVGIGISVGLKNVLPVDILPWVMIVMIVPIIAWGFFKYKDMLFEDFIRVFVDYTVNPQIRVYEDTDRNIFYHLNEEILEIDINNQLEIIENEE